MKRSVMEVTDKAKEKEKKIYIFHYIVMMELKGI